MEEDYVIPCHKLKENSRIIVYGAGKVGTFFYDTLVKSGKYSLVGWVDKRSCRERSEIDSIEWLLQQEYDCLLISIVDKDIAYAAMLELKELGVAEEKMIWEDYHSVQFYQRNMNKEMLILLGIKERLPRIENIQCHCATREVPRNVIWTGWLQGYDDAPEIVKKCNSQLKQKAGEYHVIEVTLKNVDEYIEIPDYIYKKYQDGNICDAHMADIIRVMLLAKYGGVWIDATCWFSDMVPSNYLEYPFFAYQTPICFYNRVRLASNWLLASSSNNALILCLEKYILEWWRNNDDAYDYFLMHYLMTLAVYYDLSTYAVWNMLDYFDNVTPHVMQYEFKRKFKDERWEYINEISAVHKLTYKYGEVVPDSFLEKFLSKF